jgi:hypothetical protein
MIRSFMPFDVVDLLVAGKALSNKAKTRDGVGRRDARLSDLANIVGDWFNPQLRPCVWVYADGLALRGLTSVRDRRSPHAWEINRLLVADQDRDCCLKLLEHVSSAGGRLEIGRIFLRLPADSPLLKGLMALGPRAGSHRRFRPAARRLTMSTGSLSCIMRVFRRMSAGRRG